LVQLNLVCDRPGPAMVVVPSLLRMIDIPTKEAEQCSAEVAVDPDDVVGGCTGVHQGRS
jgi:hypothetical protein